MSADSEQLLRGLRYTHDRANANTGELHATRSAVDALSELLVERGLLDADDLGERVRRRAEGLGDEYRNRGMGVELDRSAGSKYDDRPPSPIDCASRLALCQGACCRLRFPLSPEDIQEGVIRWDLGRPYIIAQDADGACHHFERGSCNCSVYAQRPRTCRDYDCRRDARIWTDYEARIPNPELGHPDWPRNTPAAAAEPAAAGTAVAPGAPGHGTIREPLPLPLRFATPPASDAATAQAAEVAGADIAPVGPLSRLLDRLVRPELRLFGRRFPSYGVFVHIGGGMGMALALLGAWWSGLSIAVMASAVAVGLATAILLAFATRSLLGTERYVWFHYQLAMTAAAAAAVACLDAPVLPHVDLLTAAQLFVLAWGRLGCLNAGCCHGRPHGWGVRYRHAHADQGFPRPLVGVRLLPVQAIEALGLFLLVGCALFAIAQEATPGWATASLLAAYGCFRSLLEHLRGDAGRPIAAGLSEAQWTSAVVTAGVLVLGAVGWLPLDPWIIGFAGGLGLLLTIAGFGHCRARRHGALLDARHLNEVADLLLQIDGQRASSRAIDGLLIATTSRGMRISTGREDDGRRHYTFSCPNHLLSAGTARALGELVRRLRHPGATTELRPGRQNGIFHLLIGRGREA